MLEEPLRKSEVVPSDATRVLRFFRIALVCSILALVTSVSSLLLYIQAVGAGQELTDAKAMIQAQAEENLALRGKEIASSQWANGGRGDLPMGRANAATGLANATAMVSEHGTICEEHSGGTCFMWECSADRGAVCTRQSWEALRWHSCTCPVGTCAGTDGRCHDHSFPATRAARMRKESYTWIFMVLFMVGRSGLDGIVMSYTGLDRIASAHKKIQTSRLWMETRTGGCTIPPFDELRREQFPDNEDLPLLPHIQTFLVCLVKLVLWHLAQPLFFWAAWFAYKDLMGWTQYLCASMVCLKEANYLILVVFGVVYAPQFLLFVPLSCPSKAEVAVYFCAPDFFVAECLARAGNFDRLQTFCVGTFIIGCPSAAVALFCGLRGNGVMFPSLFAGYVLSVCPAVLMAVRESISDV